MQSGIDMPTDAGKVIGAVVAANLDFIARYYRSPTSRWPALSASEARIISDAGLSIVTVWESASDHSSYFTRLAGVDNATTACHQARTAGQPAGSAIYFAVDYDASGTDIVGCVNEYFRGVHDGFTAAAGGAADYKVGVYGSGAVCQALVATGLADFAWLAMSTGWAGYRNFSGWHIKQGPALPGLAFGHDSDAAQDDHGGFSLPALVT